MSDAPPTTAFAPPANCWRTIGIWGDAKCPLLPKEIHCHNCHVYIESGRHQLEQPSTEEYRRQWTELLSRPTDTVSTEIKSVAIFRVGSHWLALPTAVFKSVLIPRAIHRIPHRSNAILLGLVPLQGELHLIFSLQALLSLKDDHASPTPAPIQRAIPRMILIEKDGDRWIFPVDEMSRLFDLTPEVSLNMPRDETDPAAVFLTTLFEVDGHVVNLIDHELLFAALKKNLQ